MKNYLRVHLVQAEPMTRGEHLKSKNLAFIPVPGTSDDDPGYLVVYPDGYRCYRKTVHNSLELSQYLLDKIHVALTPGVAFGDDNCIRFSYAVSDETLKMAVAKVGDVLAELADE